MVRGLEFETIPVEENWRVLKVEGTVLDGVRYLRRAGGNIIYKGVVASFVCTKCDSLIREVPVGHLILGTENPKRCYYERVPYCPKCEHNDRPSEEGSPIETDLDVEEFLKLDRSNYKIIEMWFKNKMDDSER